MKTSGATVRGCRSPLLLLHFQHDAGPWRNFLLINEPIVMEKEDAFEVYQAAP